MALIIYDASAGSGKTHTLVREYLRLAFSAEGAYRQILCMTFTRKATAEMKERIVNSLHGIATENPKMEALAKEEVLVEAAKKRGIPLKVLAQATLDSILEHYSELSVMTIDSFTKRLVDGLLWELNCNEGIEVEIGQARMIRAAVERLLEKIDPGSRLFEWLLQRMDVEFDEGEGFKPIAWLEKKSRGLLDSDFLIHRKERAELLEIESFDDLRRRVETIKAEATKRVETLRHELLQKAEEIGLGEDDFKGKSRSGWSSLVVKGDAPTRVSMELVWDAARWFDKNPPASKVELVNRHLLERYRELMRAALKKALAENSEKVIKGEMPSLPVLKALRDELNAYSVEEGKRLLADLGTMLLDAEVDGAVPFVLERVGLRYKHVMVDEFQDTSRLQWELLRAIVQNSLGIGGTALLVGDVKQAIYRWRGGDWSLMAEVEKEFHPHTEYQRVTLPRNYRSARRVIEFNNALFEQLPRLIEPFVKHLKGKMEKDTLDVCLPIELREAIDKEGEDFAHLVGVMYKDVRQEINRPESGYVEYQAGLPSAQSLGEICKPEEYLITTLQRLLKAGIPAGRIAILARTRSQVSAFVRAILDAGWEGTPPSVVSNQALSLNASNDVRVLVAAMRFVNNPALAFTQAKDGTEAISLTPSLVLLRSRLLMLEDAELPIAEAMIRATVPFTEAEALALRALLERLQGMRMNTPLRILDDLCHELQLPSDERSQRLYVDTLRGLAYNFERSESAELPNFLDYYDGLDERERSVPLDAALDAIRIMTIHDSKGLEFEVVIIPNADWDFRLKNPAPVVWAEPTHGKDDWIKETLPVSTSNDVLGSHYALAGYREHLLEFVDACNMLYVACTRAKMGLYIYRYFKLTKAGKEDGRVIKHLSNHFWNQLSNQQALLTKYGSEAQMVEEINSRKPEEASQPLRMPPRLENPRQFEFLDSSEGVLRDGSRLLGERLHALMALGEEELLRGVQRLVDEGGLEPEASRQLLAHIAEGRSQAPLTAPHDATQRGYAERDILLPNDSEGKVKRPDLVLARPQETVVVDYKFVGRLPDEEMQGKYADQVHGYAKLLTRMRMPNVRGYVWYLGVKGDLSQMVEVTPI